MKPYQLLIVDAVNDLTEGNCLTFEGTDLSTVELANDYAGSVPTTSEIQAKIDELMPAFAMDALREERDKLLAETDWWASGDLTMTTEQSNYRQALRDLPANSTGAAINTDGELTGVTWPTKP